MKQLLIGLLLVGMVGCASSGPIPMGPDTFMLEDTGAWSWSSGNRLKGDLYREADAFCRERGQYLMPIDASANHGSFTRFAHAELQFRCLNEKYAEVGRPLLWLWRWKM
jgi:hypothetical protein